MTRLRLATRVPLAVFVVLGLASSLTPNAAAAPCETATPFGVPVEPEVKMIQASSSGCGRAVRPWGVRRSVTLSPSPMSAHAPASLKTSSARSAGSSASTGTYAAPAASTPRIAR